MTIRFHDVSHFQAGYQPIGPTFAKATEGTSFLDAEYVQTKARTIGAGWPFAAYHFLHHGDIPAQAAWAYQHIGATPAMLDVERPKSGTDPTLADVTGFVDAYRKLGGVLQLVYLPHWYWVEIGSPSLQPLVDRGMVLISSDYTTYSDTGPGWTPYGGMSPAIWQYTDKPLDTNAYRGTVAQLTSLIGGSPMAIMTDADAAVLTHAPAVDNAGGFAYRDDSSAHVPAPATPRLEISVSVALQSIAGQARGANVNAAAALAQLKAASVQLEALAAKVAALPTTAAPAAPMSDADVQRIAAAVVDMLDARLAS